MGPAWSHSGAPEKALILSSTSQTSGTTFLPASAITWRMGEEGTGAEGVAAGMGRARRSTHLCHDGRHTSIDRSPAFPNPSRAPVQCTSSRLATHLIPLGAEGHMQHGAVLGGVEVLPREHGVDLGLHTRPLSQSQEKLCREIASASD